MEDTHFPNVFHWKDKAKQHRVDVESTETRRDKLNTQTLTKEVE